MTRFRRALAFAALACLPAFVCQAGDGRLLATGGASQIEGAAGGGLVPWAVLAGYGTDDQQGSAAFVTAVRTDDYGLDVIGAAWSWNNRIELSIARQTFSLDTLRDTLSLPTARFRQDVLGAKLRLRGDLVYGRGPQVSLGVQAKRQLDFQVPSLVGASDDDGIDVYVSASRLMLAAAGGRNLLLNGTLRATRANQTGLLGFGGDRRSGYSVVAEGSAAVLLDPRWAVGIEYRQKPDNLGFAREDDWRDVFVAWFPNKRVAVVGAWADLGDVATLQRQRGGYLSVQASF
ncbi:DUF3034 family protein [Luteimonas fraxinea]|uniref:DUF3034 family protein n=1 Tax=Luteimonas fraxinea TaxID=2901869 RepID=UPI001E3134B4|nr:DUF3034 family protein [Luteimonas fraxinea]MCD9126513.1 DUF3034 family protein [Luteimonas fraxinea]